MLAEEVVFAIMKRRKQIMEKDYDVALHRHWTRRCYWGNYSGCSRKNRTVPDNIRYFLIAGVLPHFLHLP